MRLLKAFAFAAVIGLGVAPSFAAKRAALLIGNSNYLNQTRLRHPASDAAALAALFRSCGFDVVLSRNDLALQEMTRAISDFAATAEGAEIIVVYYAGRGIEDDGTSYLIPTDARLGAAADLQAEAVSLDRVLQESGHAARLRLILLDSNRDNPFASGMTRQADRGGLSRDEAITPNTLIGFATKAGAVALDGDGPNSPFAAALLKHIAKPGLDVRQALRLTRDEVLTTTQRRQEPFTYGSLSGTPTAVVETCAPR